MCVLYRATYIGGLNVLVDRDICAWHTHYYRRYIIMEESLLLPIIGIVIFALVALVKFVKGFMNLKFETKMTILLFVIETIVICYIGTDLMNR